MISHKLYHKWPILTPVIFNLEDNVELILYLAGNNNHLLTDKWVVAQGKLWTHNVKLAIILSPTNILNLLPTWEEVQS